MSIAAPERIWAMRYYGKGDEGFWDTTHSPHTKEDAQHEYILHTRAALAASPLVQEIVAEAFRAGFMRSGEGWNGEYPCDDDAEEWLAVEATEIAAAIRARGEG